MRIALMSDTYVPQVNGVTTVVHRIAQALRAAGHAVAVVAPRYPRGADDSGGGGERDDGLRVFSLPFPPYPSIRLSFPLDRHADPRPSPPMPALQTEGALTQC
ncbi:MAG TPA: glycosyltransferase [Gemmatimonadales bacterium]|nr:glycosyltransferase [Gemmatimonadales bacterium]